MNSNLTDILKNYKFFKWLGQRIPLICPEKEKIEVHKECFSPTEILKSTDANMYSERAGEL